MRIWQRIESPVEPGLRGGVVTIGNFDGLHLGHRALLARAGQCSRPRIVITFDPHPARVLNPERPVFSLFPREDLGEKLPDLGIDLLLVLPFDRKFACLPAREFLSRYVEEAFSPKSLVAGFDFRFGSGREGSLDSLRLWCETRGIGLQIVPPLAVGGEVVSSSRIRSRVREGDVAGARRLLGREFYLRGQVVPGAGRGGAVLGVPTLNQKVVNETLPKEGVYVTRVRWRGRALPAVTNIGVNPTFGDVDGVKVETHVLSGQAPGTGQCVDVDFVERLRAEKKFDRVEDLKSQIERDILDARRILKEHE